MANKVLTASKDNTANQIINFLNKYKINYRGGSVDSNIENVTGKLAKYDEIEKDVPRGASVYRMSCWNGGQNGLRKDYASADIVSPNNNTDTKWYFVVNKGECSIISYERGNYGLSDKKNNIGKFKIK